MAFTNIKSPVISQCANMMTLMSESIGHVLRMMIISDAHLAFDDEYGIPYADYSRRMAQGSGKSAVGLEAALGTARAGQYDFIALTGDILSFPSVSGVDTIVKILNASGIPWGYTAGNHDWHFEGLAGSSFQVRDEWCNGWLKPLFQGNNPLMYTMELKGAKLIFIDNSLYEILPEQLEFLQAELSQRMPSLLLAHVPLYVPGRSVFFGCGHPQWGRASDELWKIERREPWAEKHSETTMEFHKTVFTAPNLLGIIAGHTHSLSSDFMNDKIQLIAPAFLQNGQFLEVEIRPLCD